MFRRIFLTGILAGLLAGIVAGALGAVKLTPLIAAAERYEAATPGHAHDDAGWEPAPGLERAGLTMLAKSIIGVGFGLLLSAGFALRQIVGGAETGLSHGVLWGIAGFACFSLAPALGLPPELPGSVSADLLARQGWWLGTALATAAGIGLLVFARRHSWRIVGVIVILLPHLAGAPHPPVEGGAAPAGLAAEFAAASLAVAAVFWIVLGSAGGWLYQRLGRSG
ncbi:MAG TPA: CbtA family protein [Stellaceae bacterium]